jgi:hypothetical protein
VKPVLIKLCLGSDKVCDCVYHQTKKQFLIIKYIAFSREGDLVFVNHASPGSRGNLLFYPEDTGQGFLEIISKVPDEAIVWPHAQLMGLHSLRNALENWSRHEVIPPIHSVQLILLAKRLFQEQTGREYDPYELPMGKKGNRE